MNLKITRAIIDAIHENQLDNVEYEKSPVFGFDVPKTCPNVSSEILNPRNTWQNKVEKEKNQINFFVSLKIASFCSFYYLLFSFEYSILFYFLVYLFS